MRVKTVKFENYAMRDVLNGLLDDRPKRRCPEGRVVLHFDSNGRLRKVVDTVVYKFRNSNPVRGV